MSRDHDLLVTLEENAIAGGAGAAVSEWLNAAGILMPVLQLGLPDRFLEHGKPEQMLAAVGLDAAGIQRSIEQRLERLKPLRSAAGIRA